VNPKPRYYLIVLLAATNLASALLAWNVYRESKRLRAVSLQSESARADLQKQLWALEKRKHELDAEVAGLRARAIATTWPMETIRARRGRRLAAPDDLTGAPG